MSDNLRRLAAVRTALIKYHPERDSKRLRRHLSTLAALVSGIVAAGSVHLAKLAHKAPDQPPLERRTRRFSRLLKNTRFTPERFYQRFARLIAERLSQHGPLLVILDGLRPLAADAPR